MAEKEVHTTRIKKSPRKTTVKKTAAKVGAAKRTSSKKNVSSRKNIIRKAPTGIKENCVHEKKQSIVFWSGVGILCLVFIVSIAIGVSGTGRINIEHRLIDIRESSTPEEQAVIDSIPVKTNSLPDGGLVPSGVPLEAPVTTPVSTTTDDLASTVPDTASSTSVQTGTEGDSETLSTTTVSTGTTTGTDIVP